MKDRFQHPNGCICYDCYLCHVCNAHDSGSELVMFDYTDDLTQRQRDFLKHLEPYLSSNGDICDIDRITLSDIDGSSPKLVNVWKGTGRDLQRRCKMFDIMIDIKICTFLILKNQELMILDHSEENAENITLYWQAIDAYDMDIPDREKLY